jgi:hypothetical protein
MRYVAIALAALAVTPQAFAADVPPLETDASAFASTIAGRPVAVVCNTRTEWLTLARLGGFDAEQTWGFVVFHQGLPVDETQLSDRACLYLETFRAAADKEAVTTRCRTGTRIVYRTEIVTKQVKVTIEGQTITREVKRPVQRKKAEAVYGVCPDYGLTLSALVTLAHESVHLRGFADEGIAECYGMQLMDDAARAFGSSEELAARLARDYWTLSYSRLRPDSGYYRSDCVDGSILDLSPDTGAWPAGDDAVVPGP